MSEQPIAHGNGGGVVLAWPVSIATRGRGGGSVRSDPDGGPLILGAYEGGSSRAGWLIRSGRADQPISWKASPSSQRPTATATLAWA
jgi:hypothetical protein